MQPYFLRNPHHNHAVGQMMSPEPHLPDLPDQGASYLRPIFLILEEPRVSGMSDLQEASAPEPRRYLCEQLHLTRQSPAKVPQHSSSMTQRFLSDETQPLKKKEINHMSSTKHQLHHAEGRPKQ
jgi:hypothetical protein